MSYCRKEDKDTIIFATKENHAQPSTVKLPPIEKQPGLILPDGNINWNCPCLGGIATGPCGIEFREAFTCFHYSQTEPQGSECMDSFRSMTECMKQYPKLYSSRSEPENVYPEDDDDFDEFDEIEPAKVSKSMESVQPNKDK